MIRSSLCTCAVVWRIHWLAYETVAFVETIGRNRDGFPVLVRDRSMIKRWCQGGPGLSRNGCLCKCSKESSFPYGNLCVAFVGSRYRRHRCVNESTSSNLVSVVTLTVPALAVVFWPFHWHRRILTKAASRSVLLRVCPRPPFVRRG